MRVVSLLPSATELLFAAGGGDLLVGRSHECDFPPAALAAPVLTSARIAHTAAADAPAAVDEAAIDAAVRASLASGESLYRIDEELLRNQDDEFNHRLKRSGGRILLVPDVEVLYVARSTYRQLARMFWQYGLYKPLAASKLGAIPTMRQLVPPAFVLAVVAGAAAALLWPQGWFLLAAVLSAYTVAVVSQALPIAVREGAGVALGFACSLPIMHVGYGTGWLTGAVRLLRRGPSSAPREDLGLSR
jgi:hypothetical protein